MYWTPTRVSQNNHEYGNNTFGEVRTCIILPHCKSFASIVPGTGPIFCGTGIRQQLPDEMSISTIKSDEEMRALRDKEVEYVDAGNVIGDITSKKRTVRERKEVIAGMDKLTSRQKGMVEEEMKKDHLGENESGRSAYSVGSSLGDVSLFCCNCLDENTDDCDYKIYQPHLEGAALTRMQEGLDGIDTIATPKAVRFAMYLAYWRQIMYHGDVELMRYNPNMRFNVPWCVREKIREAYPDVQVYEQRPRNNKKRAKVTEDKKPAARK